MTKVQNDPTPAGLEDDSRFRQNLRSRLDEQDQERLQDQALLEKERKVAMLRRKAELEHAKEWADPMANLGARWMSGLIGGLIVALGVLWFLSFLGFTVPLIAAVPVFLTVLGLTMIGLAVRPGGQAEGAN